MLYLFDIDGTLIGGDGSGRRAFERACDEQLGIPEALGPLALDGMTDPLILAWVFDHHQQRLPSEAERRLLIAAYLEHLEEEVLAGKFHVKPAVHETLDQLEEAGGTLGLATGNLRSGARIKLQRGDLWRRFGFGGFGDDAPATVDGRTELVRAAIARGEALAGRRFARAEIFVVGDTPKDVAAAHGAGVQAVGVATGRFSVAELAAAGADVAHATLAEWRATL